MIKITSNIKKVLQQVGSLEQVKRDAAKESLRNVTKYGKKQGAKAIRDTRYSTTPLKELERSMVRGGRYKENQEVNKMFSTLRVVGGPIKLMHMRPKNEKVRSRYGKRWAVSIQSGSLKEGREVTGAFHLYSYGKANLVGAGGKPFKKNSKLFNRGEGKTLIAYKFRTPSEVMEDSGVLGHVEALCNTYLGKQMQRNFERQLYMKGTKEANWSK